MHEYFLIQLEESVYLVKIESLSLGGQTHWNMKVDNTIIIINIFIFGKRNYYYKT